MPKYKYILDAPPEVISRYYIRKFWPHAHALARKYSRVSLTLKERKKNKQLKNTLDTYRRVAVRAEKSGNQCVQALMNIGLFYIIAENDIQAVKIDALTHPDEWKRKLSLRVILLTIHEWDMGKVVGKDIRDLLSQSSVPAELQNQLFGSIRMLKKAQEKAAKLLREPRNSVIAHRDADALSQIRVIDSLNAKDVFCAAEDFYSASHCFMHSFAEVLSQAGSIHGQFAFMLNKK